MVQTNKRQIWTFSIKYVYLSLKCLSLWRCFSACVVSPPLPFILICLISSLTDKKRTRSGVKRSVGQSYAQWPSCGMSVLLVSLAIPYAVVLCQNLVEIKQMVLCSTMRLFLKCISNPKFDWFFCVELMFLRIVP